MNIYEGNITGKKLNFAIVVARFNSFITSKLLDGARAFEIPVVAKKLASLKKYDAIICLGAVIRGATTHYDYVCNEVSKGIAQVGLQSGVPTIFGIVTTENIQQAIERAGTKSGNKGFDAAVSAMEMANLMKTISKAEKNSDAPKRRTRRSKVVEETTA